MTAYSLKDLRSCLAEHLDRDLAGISTQLRLVEDLGIDSLAMHAVLIDIEAAGGKIPPPETLERVITVADLFAAVSVEPVV